MTTLRQVCHCDNCGNEADMVVTCTWVNVVEEPGKVTTVCGNGADMILDDSE